MERIFFDNGILSQLCNDCHGKLWNSFLDVTTDNGITIENRRVRIESDPLLFLEFIGHGRILDKIPQILFIKDLGQSLFEPSADFLQEDRINDSLDKMFDACIKAVEKIEDLQPNILISKFNEHIKYLKGKGAPFLISRIADPMLSDLKNEPQKAYKIICGSLAWHLLITSLRSTFDQITTKSNPTLVLKIFEPLMANIHHLITKKELHPNIFRLSEAMYLSTIKQQLSSKNNEELKWIQEYEREYKTGNKKDLCDCAYIDKALIGYVDFFNEEFTQQPITVFTCDSPSQVLKRLSLFRNVLEKLVREVKDWKINPQFCCKVYCLKAEEQFTLVDIVEHAINCPLIVDLTVM